MMRRIVMTAVAGMTLLPAVGFAMPGAGAPAAAPAAAEQGEPAPISGTVLETMDSGGYTYINLKQTDGASAWYAVPSTAVKAGSTVAVKPGMPMGQFTSKSLKRTFDNIVFSPGLAGEAPEVAADKVKELAHKGVDLSAGFKGDGSANAEPMATIKVDKATAAGSYTVAELFAATGPKDGSAVSVRGKVVKSSPGIMGRSWLHLQDGSGDPAKKDNDLVVTSPAGAKVGEVVTVKGTLSRDKDFGAGYLFNVIVEDAEITR